ncbi:Rib/alpha-like domain-containing protein [Streptococcus salivarius]|uniref:Rib/alpha-like domain-containing protein n=1 Tax=Streptococcus salivarius TaxID=1304 RepID=UPI0015841718|nr:Rib/alpha-like domain-containing protein [Streptococcus salivarius]
MGKDLFNEKKSRFSLRKLNIGVCSVLLGTLIMIGGTAQADENTETTAAPVSPVVEAGETTASLVETRTVAETTPAATTAAATSAEAPAAVETPATSTAPATTTESATSQAAATSEAASTSAASTSETAQASTSEAAQATNSSEAEKPRVRSRRAVPAAAPTSATEASTKNVSTSIEAGDEYVTIRTDAASTIKVTVDGQEVSINGADGVYTFKRPSAGGTVVATATDASGKNATKQLIVSPSTVNGVIKPSDSSLTITNKFDTTGITTDKEPPYVVKNAGVEFDKVNDDGTISLTGTSWTRLAGGWAKDKAFPLGAHMILNFQNPTFYENIEKITIKPTASGSAQSFTRHEDGSVWSVPIANNTVASGGIGAAYDHPITITLKNGKTLNDLGLANTPLSFSSAWITGKDYGKVIPNKLVRESIDNSWFIASDNAKKTASDNGLTNAFTGTPGKGVNTQPTLKVLPRFTSDGKADSIELVYTMKVSAAMGVINLASNTFQSVPYIEQELPKSLLPYLDLNETYIYKSDADGSAVSGVQKTKVVMDASGKLDTRNTDAISIATKSNPSQSDVDKVRSYIDKNILGTASGQLGSYTISYKIKDTVDSVELAKKLNAEIKKNNGMLLFEQWMERGVKPNLSAIQRSWKGNTEGVHQGSYANAFLDTNLLIVNAPKNQTYDVTYSKSVVTAGDTTQPQIPLVRDVEGKEVPVPSGTTFKAGTLPTGIDSVSVDENTGAITSKTSANATPGLVNVPMLVTYPDGTTETVDVPIEIKAKQTDADKYEPTAKDQTVNLGDTPDAKGSIGNVSDLPTGTSFEYKTPVDTTTAGEKDATVVVTYPDGSKDEVPVKVTVKDPRTDADKNTPTAKDQTVNLGDTPDAKNSIGNVSDLPSGTTFEYKIPVDTTTAGEKDATVVVTYPDGSKDEVPVKVTVKDPRTDADKNTPTAKDQTVNLGDTPDAKGSIGNVSDLPSGTTFEYKTPVDTTTAGEKDATVVVTYPDGSKDEVPVKVTVKDPRTDADKNTPTAKDQTVNIGDTPDAKGSIGNVSDLPSGTKFEYKTPVDTTTAGEKDATVVVTYPDGSKDEVPVKVTVKDPRTDADKNTPVAKDQTVNIGETPDAKGSIGNVSDLPSGTTFEYKTPVDTTTASEKDATVVVTYPDGSKDEVPVKVTVKDPRTDADKNDPTAKDQTVKVGDTPDAKNSIGNVSDLPSGTTFEFKTPVDTTTEGEKDATVVVTYPDGSKDEVPVKVTVVANPTQADENTPVAKDQTVNLGGTPDAKNSIGNVSDLPEGTTFEYKTPVDTTTEGDKDATVIVTYPDGSKDEVPVKVTVKDPRTDADKNTPVAKDQTVKPGDQPNAKDSIGNVGDLPEGTKFEYKTPVDTTTEGEKDATVVVTYPDGSKDEVPVKVTVKDPRTDADKNDPTAKDQTVKVGDTPDAKNSIGNVSDLPSGTTFEFKTPVDTTTEGEKDVTVVVTYPDGSKDEVPVKVTVVANPTQADLNTPVAKDQTVKPGDQPNAKDSIGNVGDLPEGTTFEYKTPVDTTTEGEKDATVVVTYPDGSKDEVPVKVIVKDPRTDADKNTPTAKDQTVKVGDTPDAKDSIGNVGDLPEGTTFEYKTPVDTTTEGDKDATVVVTYPDGSKDEVPVKVTVVANPTQADLNTPVAKDQTVKPGDQPNAKDSIGNVSDLPSGTTFEYKTPVDTTTEGEKDATVVVTYPDGSKDEVPVKVIVKDPRTDADKNTPVAKDQTVKPGDQPNAKDSIGNVGDLPEGTTFEYKTPVDTTTEGEKDATVVVTYPDGSTDEVPVKVIVKDPRTDADKNTPVAKDQTVKPGDQPNAKDSIGNVGDLPEGTKFEYKTPVDTTTEGDKDATVIVTYPDGSKDEVPVKIIVKDPRTDADKNTPVAKDQTVKLGDQPSAKDSIGNVVDLPEGTKFEYKTPVDTTTEGDKDATVIVTYPDGSKDEVPVKIIVKDPRTDADKNTPVAKDQTVKLGDQPNAKDSIGNVGDLPEGTKFEYKTPVDTTTEGEKDATVVVTYPDGSKDEVPVKVTVKDPRTDADKNTPVAKDQTVKPGYKPNAKDSIGNVGDLPEGTKFEYKIPVDTTTEGEKDATVIVTYPDGSKDEVPVKVTVKDPSTDADKNTPVAKDQTVKPGDQPNAKDSIGNVGDLPEGTKFEYKTPVDTTTEGDKDATVVVTYPDGSKDEVPVKVIVKDPRTDADKNTPVAKDQTVKPGDQPNAKDSIGNVGDLPEGTKFEYKTPVDTTTEGDKDATVVVTYPDGSKDEVPVKVTVKDPRTDVDKNTPMVDNQVTKATPAPTVHKPAPALDTVHVASKATPAATDTKQALPETGENTSLLATLLGGLMTVAGLGLAGKRKKED